MPKKSTSSKQHYNIGKNIKKVHAHAKTLKSCISCTKENHNHTRDGNKHRFHTSPDNPNPFCSTHFSLKNSDVRKSCAGKAWWWVKRRNRIIRHYDDD